MAHVDYEREFYCSFGGHKVKHGNEVYGKGKRRVPRCPRHGVPLRYKFRNKN